MCNSQKKLCGYAGYYSLTEATTISSGFSRRISFALFLTIVYIIFWYLKLKLIHQNTYLFSAASIVWDFPGFWFQDIFFLSVCSFAVFLVLGGWFVCLYVCLGFFVWVLFGFVFRKKIRILQYWQTCEGLNSKNNAVLS